MAGRSSLQPPPSFDQLGRRNAERVGGGDKVGLVRFEEAQSRGQHAGITNPIAQIRGGKAGQREQALRPRRLAQRPAKRCQRQSLRVVCVLNPHALVSIRWDKKSSLSRTTNSI